MPRPLSSDGAAEAAAEDRHVRRPSNARTRTRPAPATPQARRWGADIVDMQASPVTRARARRAHRSGRVLQRRDRRGQRGVPSPLAADQKGARVRESGAPSGRLETLRWLRPPEQTWPSVYAESTPPVLLTEAS